MSPSASPNGAGGAGKRLDRDLIVRAALKFIDEHGAQGLTMRGLGQELGVEAMSLYRYVSGREELLEAVIELLLSRVADDLDDELGETWQGYLQTMAHAIRQIAIKHAAVFPLVATRHPAAPWLRPPLRSLDLVEEFLSTLVGKGFTDKQAVDTYRTFSSFLLGTLLLEAAMRGAETSPVEVPLDEGDATVPNEDGEVDLGENPTVLRLQSMLSEDRSDEEFEISLEALLDRLELIISQ